MPRRALRWCQLPADPALPRRRAARTLRELHRRLQPGAAWWWPTSVPQDPAGKLRWLQRYAAFAEASGVAHADAQRAIDAIAERLPLLAPNRK